MWSPTFRRDNPLDRTQILGSNHCEWSLSIKDIHVIKLTYLALLYFTYPHTKSSWYIASHAISYSTILSTHDAVNDLPPPLNIIHPIQFFITHQYWPYTYRDGYVTNLYTLAAWRKKTTPLNPYQNSRLTGYILEIPNTAWWIVPKSSS